MKREKERERSWGGGNSGEGATNAQNKVNKQNRHMTLEFFKSKKGVGKGVKLLTDVDAKRWKDSQFADDLAIRVFSACGCRCILPNCCNRYVGNLVRRVV